MVSFDYTIKEVFNDRIVSKDIHKIEMSLDKIEKSGFKHFMLKEIYEQPTSIKGGISVGFCCCSYFCWKFSEGSYGIIHNYYKHL